MPSSAILHLINHGETVWNEQGRMQGWQDSPLTPKGRYAASLLAVELWPLPLSAVYASPSPSAIQTAGILTAGRPLPFRTHEEIKEIHLGEWEGCALSELSQADSELFRTFQQRPDRFSVTGGESFRQLEKRVWECIRKLALMHAGEEVLVVSHAFALRAFLGRCDGRSLGALWVNPPIPPGSHSIVKVSAKGATRILQYAGAARTAQRRVPTAVS